MARIIGGVIIGYLAMAAFVFVTMSLAYLAMGAEMAFKPGSYEVTGVWVVTSIALSLAAAMIGGFICMLVARRGTAGRALAVVVFILGVAFALPALINPEPVLPRSAEVSDFEAMHSARQPTRILLATPLIGASGVILGARMARRRVARVDSPTLP